jgi:hypothetical protein
MLQVYIDEHDRRGIQATLADLVASRLMAASETVGAS